MELLESCRALLLDHDVNPASVIEFDVNGEVHSLSLQQIAESYMQASDEAQLVFYTALKKAVEQESMGVRKFFEGMGKLLLMAANSEHFDTGTAGTDKG